MDEADDGKSRDQRRAREVGFISHYRYAAKKLGEQQHVWEAFGERQPPWSASSDLTRVGKTAAAPLAAYGSNAGSN